MTAGPVAPLILTALLDPVSQACFEQARQRHFPQRLNLIPAHVTLFHALPGIALAEVMDTLARLCATEAVSGFSVTGVISLGRGTAYALDMPAVAALRQRLAAGWSDWLTPQDRQRWRSHVTVQNKVSPAEAAALAADLRAVPPPLPGIVLGLGLWHYRGGPWEQAGEYLFGRKP